MHSRPHLYRRNADLRLREIERRAAAGDPEAQFALWQQRIRVGEISVLDLLFLAHLGWLPAMSWRDRLSPGEFRAALVAAGVDTQAILAHPVGTRYLGRGPGFSRDDEIESPKNMAWLPDTNEWQAFRDWLHDMHVYSPQAWLRASLVLFEDVINIEQNGLEEHTGLHVCRVARAVARAVLGRRPRQGPRPATKGEARARERWSAEMGAASELLEYPPTGQEAEREVTNAGQALLGLLQDPAQVEPAWVEVTTIINIMEELRGWDRWVIERALVTVQEELVPWVLGEESSFVKRTADLGPHESKWQDAWCLWDRTLAEMQAELGWDEWEDE